ncbi:MAG: transferrin receptor-like dimerization domain-containing protein [Steroidobacteraceae bacterium]
MALRLAARALQAACLLSCVTIAAEPPPSAMLGFSAAHASDERALEQRFDSALDAADQRGWVQRMASEPNQVGSAHDKANAQFMLEQFRAWGWDAQIESFSVLYPTPKLVALQLIAPTRFTAKLHEPAVPGDRSSGNTAAGLPPYNVYGADGDVTGDLVYVNYGMPDDYKELTRRGIDVQGKIVIARYRGGWRGLKVKLAHEHGAIACLIYSDPRDDGYFMGDVYPRGGWRPADGVQRGSVADITLYSGDPLTPGVGATADAKRLPIADAPAIMKIPALPISYADAQPLLAALTGPVAPTAWRGALPITYHIGPGPAKVHLRVQSDWSQKPIYDVIARVRGSQLPDEWIVRGNHHDGWVFGAWDPLSGNAALLAEAKSIGALLKSGWRPRRTLIYCSWDGEEPGLLGSTEWAEMHAQELRAHAVMYVNSDSNVRGFLEAGGSHSLERLINEVSAGVHDPETDGSVQARWRAKLRVDAFGSANDEAKQLAEAAASSADVPIGALGTGSDFTPFLQHLGIATLSLEYGGEADDDGVYHSNYDTFEHYVRFGDPSFAYGIVESETVGHVVLRAADADVLPMQFTDVADVFAGYVKELHKLADDKRARAQTLSALLTARAFELSSDPTRPVGPPAQESEVPYLDFAPLDNAITRLKRSAKAYDEGYERAAGAGLALNDAQRAQLDQLLQGLEQTLMSEDGLPGRPWYRHLLYAPGLLTGYGVKTMPTVREAIEEGHWDQAGQYVPIVAQAIDAYCQRLDAATGLLH